MGDYLGNKVQNWLQKQFPGPIKDDYDPKQSELAVAVAAVTYSICSLEETEARYRRTAREELKLSRTKSKSIKENTPTRQPSSARLTRGLDSKHQERGESSSRNLVEVERWQHESTIPISRPSHSSTVRTMSTGERKPKQQARHKNVETRAVAWEKNQMEKINKWHEKVRSSILTWENERKMEAKLKMERKMRELEHKRALNQQHYQNKIARIERIARGAKAQVEEERRNKEHEIKQRAKKIRSKRKFPLILFCC
ncbi:remorin isoform X2 [Mangifera indica]|nr:remorin isoform X2 [Mangifera indica]